MAVPVDKVAIPLDVAERVAAGQRIAVPRQRVGSQRQVGQGAVELVQLQEAVEVGAEAARAGVNALRTGVEALAGVAVVVI